MTQMPKMRPSHLPPLFAALATSLLLAVSGPVAGQEDDNAVWRLKINDAAKAFQTGDIAQSEAAARQALEVARAKFGPQDLRTAASLDNLAAVYSTEGRYADAERLLRESLELRRVVLGPKHPDTLASFNNLAVADQSEGRYADAEALLIEALAVRREVLGPKNPDTLSSLSNLAALYQSQGRYTDAEPLLQEVLQDRRELLGSSHPDTLAKFQQPCSVISEPRPLCGCRAPPPRSGIVELQCTRRAQSRHALEPQQSCHSLCKRGPL